MNTLLSPTVLVFISGLGLLTACGGDESVKSQQGAAKSTALQAAPAARPAMVETLSGDDMHGLSFSGVVQPAQRAELAFRLNGNLMRLNVQEGDKVTAGQVLAQLDQQEFKLALDSAAAQYRKAQADHQRGAELFRQSGVISQAELEQLETAKALSHNQYQDAKRNLANATLTAPFSGVVARRLTDNYTQVQANQPVLVLHNLDELDVVLHVPAQLFLQSGQRHKTALAKLEGITHPPLPLTFKYFSSDADPQTQTYEVVMTFTDRQGVNVLPGMSVQVLPGTSSTASLLTVPLSAVQSDNIGGQFVWLVGKDARVQQQQVIVGQLLGERVVIDSGLSLGDKVVIAGVAALRSGLQIRPVDIKGAS